MLVLILVLILLLVLSININTCITINNGICISTNNSNIIIMNIIYMVIRIHVINTSSILLRYCPCASLRLPRESGGGPAASLLSYRNVAATVAVIHDEY